jgi:hypothetical protein
VRLEFCLIFHVYQPNEEDEGRFLGEVVICEAEKAAACIQRSRVGSANRSMTNPVEGFMVGCIGGMEVIWLNAKVCLRRGPAAGVTGVVLNIYALFMAGRTR